jgi:Zn finger protein HypA/HybF involved in hydrogenase expression
MWLASGDLRCDDCPVVLEYPGPHIIVLNAARAKGWHLFQGKSLTGKEMNTHVCPECMGTNRSVVKSKAVPMDGDAALF